VKIKLGNVKALCVGGQMVAIDRDKDMEYEETLVLVDDDDNMIIDAEEPVLAFTGTDGERYIVGLTSVNAFQVKR